MRYFLVDYETVQNLDGIENLTKSDVVIVLFTDDTKGIDFRTLSKMNQSKAEIQQKLVNITHNDNIMFDMCCVVSFLVGQLSAMGHEVVLIAKSDGFAQFLKEQDWESFGIARQVEEEAVVEKEVEEEAGRYFRSFALAMQTAEPQPRKKKVKKKKVNLSVFESIQKYLSVDAKSAPSGNVSSGSTQPTENILTALESIGMLNEELRKQQTKRGF